MAKPLPEAATLHEFFENPEMLRPKNEFANATIESETTLIHAIKLQSLVAVKSLLRIGADPNSQNVRGITPITAAAQKGNIDIVQSLIDAGAAVNDLNSAGSTALIQASHFGKLDVVQLLLTNSAIADFANLKGTTALMRASQEGFTDICKILIDHNADVNKKNIEGMNCMMLASQRGNPDVVLLLIKAGAEMDDQTGQGSTALMLACKRGHEKCVEVLVTMGAEICMKDSRLRTARDTAVKREFPNLLCWLDTQAQIRQVQQYRRRQRSSQLQDIRTAAQAGRLFMNNSDLLDIQSASQSKQLRLQLSKLQLGEAQPAGTAATDTDTLPAILKPLCTHYEDWEWPLLLQRACRLPPEIFDLVVDFMPAPRVWQWNLCRLKRRTRICPYQAIVDIGIVMDEILTDACIFRGSHQQSHLTRINRNQHVCRHLQLIWNIPEILVQQLVKWSDVQSLVSRCTEQDIGFKYQMAREMLLVGIGLFKWNRKRLEPPKDCVGAEAALDTSQSGAASGASAGNDSCAAGSPTHNNPAEEGGDDEEEEEEEEDNDAEELEDPA